MNSDVTTSAEQSSDHRQRLALAGIVIGLACLIAAGALLWSHEGAHVFINVVMSGIAACF